MWWVAAYLLGETVSWSITEDVLADVVGRRADLALERDPARPPGALRLIYVRPFTEPAFAHEHLSELRLLPHPELMWLILHENLDLEDLSEVEPNRFEIPLLSPRNKPDEPDDPNGGVIARHRRPPDHPIGTLTGSFRMKWPEAEGE